MDDNISLGIWLVFEDDSVRAFEPTKVICRIRDRFPTAEIDSTDHQRVRLLQELDIWATQAYEPELRERLIRQSWRLYQTNGPTYRFVIAFPTGHRVRGGARRLSVYFSIPKDLPTESYEELVSLLLSLQMGTPIRDDENDDPKPNVIDVGGQ